MLANAYTHGSLYIGLLGSSGKSVQVELLGILLTVQHFDQNLKKQTRPIVLFLLLEACGFLHLHEENPIPEASQLTLLVKTRSNHEMDISNLWSHRNSPEVLVVFHDACMRCNKPLLTCPPYEQLLRIIHRCHRRNSRRVLECVLLCKPIAIPLAIGVKTRLEVFLSMCTSHMKYLHLPEKHRILPKEVVRHQSRQQANVL